MKRFLCIALALAWIALAGTAAAEANGTKAVTDSSIVIEIGNDGHVTIINHSDNSIVAPLPDDGDEGGEDEAEDPANPAPAVDIGILIQGRADTSIAVANPTGELQHGLLLVGNTIYSLAVQAYESGIFALSEIQDEDGIYQVSLHGSSDLMLRVFRNVDGELF
jgi:hypothetical protein